MTIDKNKKTINHSDSEALDNFHKLLINIHMLHDSSTGCPWHISQTRESLIPYLTEEYNELINALLKGGRINIIEELGDLLLQIILHAEISSKQKEFDLKDVIHTLNQKILFRHPYIFDEKKKISIEEANKIWERQKILEKKNLNN